METQAGRDYCVDSSTDIKDKIIAQTIFLGASVIDFNANIGWGEQPSTLTVNLVNDLSYTGCPQTQILNGNGSDNTYYSAGNDGLYIKPDGTPVNRRHPEAMLPGKVYYQTNYNSNYQVNQLWWQNKDPGFIGDATNLNTDGSVTYNDSTSFFKPRGFNITNCPVYFKMGDFSFGGVVQSWKKNKGESGDIYTVVVHSMQALLNNCTVILDKYAGSISGRTSFAWSAPSNYVGNLLTYNNTNNEKGNIPNIFNVYGFLESFGAYNFGGSSYKKEEGFLCSEVITALRVLTGADNLNDRTRTNHSDFGPKTAFSPYGRIIAPTVSDPITGDRYTSNKWGVIAPATPTNQSGFLWTGRDRCNFKLDLSELQKAVYESGAVKRIKADSMSISQFIDYVCDEHGLDWTTDLLNTPTGWVIKVIAVSRRFAPTINAVKSTVNQMICDGIETGSFSFGKEANETNSRALVIGAPQQRLYQAKNTRLAYTQSSYIFNPTNEVFVDYYAYGNIGVNSLSGRPSCNDNSGFRTTVGGIFHYGKIKFPAFYSTRNPVIDIRVPSLKNDDVVHDAIEGGGFTTNDTIFQDSELDSSSLTANRRGNYKQSYKLLHGIDARFGINPCPNGGLTLNSSIGSQAREGTSITGKRFFPLYRDVICPFFGHLLEDRYGIDGANKNTDFIRIRPVWYDFWTGQIVLLFHKDELPRTRIELSGRYTDYTMNRRSDITMYYPQFTLNASSFGGTTSPGVATAATASYTAEWFMVTENEIRAAMAGTDNFVSYTLGKRYKTDLYIMMNAAYTYRSKQRYLNEGMSNAKASRMAYDENNWHWQFYREGITGAEGNIAPENSLTAQSLHSLSSEARKDFDLLSKFLQKLGNTYYGKQYMVTAPFLQSRTEQDNYDYQLKTEQGNISVFKGGGEIRYNYEPCAADNGAWEEPGNSIDDMIAGDRNVAALCNDKGQIKPILGYNSTYVFDYARRELARRTLYQVNNRAGSTNPYFSYSAWDSISMLRKADSTTNSKYYFENLNIGDLANSMGDFVIVECPNNNNIINLWQLQPNAPTPPTYIIGKDAFGLSHGAKKKKLYRTCNVDGKFHFMDPEKMLEPKIIVSTDFLGLNNSSEQYQTDPSNTVSATIGMEELAMYTRSGGRNYAEYQKFFQFFSPYRQYNKLLAELAPLSDNSTGKNVKIAPKAAHPFFAGIPIKSNTYCYGPWTNYPAIYPMDKLFTLGNEVTIDDVDTAYNTCTSTAMSNPTTDQRDLLVDNWITNTKFEVIEDFCPWNFGGMRNLDDVASKYVSGVSNFQTSIEVGSLEAVGTPLFKLGGAFSSSCLLEDLSFVPGQTQTYTWTEVKQGSIFPNSWPSLTEIGNYNEINDPGYIQGTIDYIVPDIPIKDLGGNRIEYNYYSNAPILTNIMTSMGQNGITTTYSFRTYTRKLSLFNRQEIDRAKKLGQENMKRKHEISRLEQRVNNNQFADREKIKREQFNDAKEAPQLALGTSPVTTIVCSTRKSLGQFNNMHQDSSFGSYSAPVVLGGSEAPQVSYSGSGPNDRAPNGHLGSSDFSQMTGDNQARYMFFEQRNETSAKIYPDSELADALNDTWGRASIMSLDGIFSPISFYPTIGKDTFSISKYDQTRCPICNGTKGISRKYKRYKTATNTSSSGGNINFCCDSCTRPYGKVNASTYFGSTTTSKDGEYFPPYIISSGQTLDELKKFNTFIFQRSIKDNTDRLGMSVTIPINVSTLQPVVMPYHEFSNANAQDYEGAHPDGAHDSLYCGNELRKFEDKGRNSISVIGRGAVFKDCMANLNSAPNIGLSGTMSTDAGWVRNHDYDYLDSRFKERISGTEHSAYNKDYEQNMRFVGFRGPMMMHGWGYDIEGYPVPNAADEPRDIDAYGRPLRFKTSRTVESDSVKYSSLAVGEAFCRDSSDDTTETVKLHTLNIQNSTYYNRKGSNLTDDTMVYRIIYKDDYSDGGGYDPATYNGSIVSKTQKYQNGQWTPKIKLKQFYLNWAERQDLWPVGPIDLRWDPERKVWSANTQKIYKMVYVTLEEDMTKDPDLDESFPARGFLDDLEYSTQALAANKRRLVYVKDRSGYSAPRGARLYCRYDSDTGFYEPVSKQQFTVYGSISAGGNTATVTMSYVQGKKRGESAPTMSITFKNPLGFSTTGGSGMFSYIDGEWTLISSR